jgi:hypothetical protein
MGIADVRVNVHLKSKKKTKAKKGKMKRKLGLTTRGLCCGNTDEEVDFSEEVQVTDLVDVDVQLAEWRRRHGYVDDIKETVEDAVAVEEEVASPAEDGSQPAAGSRSRPPGALTIEEANALGTDIMRETLLGMANTRERSQQTGAAIESTMMVDTLYETALDNPASRELLEEPALSVDIPLVEHVAQASPAPESLTRGNIVETSTDQLARSTGLSPGAINRQKLVLMGVPLKDHMGRSGDSQPPSGEPGGDDEPPADGSDGAGKPPTDGDDEGHTEDDTDLDVDVEADPDGDGDEEIDAELHADVFDDDEASGGDADDQPE